MMMMRRRLLLVSVFICMFVASVYTLPNQHIENDKALEVIRDDKNVRKIEYEDDEDEEDEDEEERMLIPNEKGFFIVKDMFCDVKFPDGISRVTTDLSVNLQYKVETYELAKKVDYVLDTVGKQQAVACLKIKGLLNA